MDPSTAGSQCTAPNEANPDVDGPGIRGSIYTQAFLALVPPLILVILRTFKLSDRMPDKLKDAFDTNMMLVLTTGVSILVASFIQGNNQELNLYDAIIVLQLSWMNNLTAAMPTLYLLLEFGYWSYEGLSTFLLYSTHSVMTGAFGIWLFHDVDSWAPGCADQLNVVLGGHVLAVNGPGLRGAVLFVSALAVVPVVNGFLIFILAAILKTFTYSIFKLLPVFIWAIPIFILVCSTEQFVYTNSFVISADSAEDEETWGFGQVVAVIMVVFPVWSMLVDTFWLIKNRGKDPEDRRGAELNRDEETGEKTE